MTRHSRRPVPALAARLAAGGLLAAALAGAAPGLGGCISLLPQEKPVQTYRLASASEPAPASAPTPIAPPGARGADRVGIVLARVELPRPAAGDRLLAVTGIETAYIAKARWVSPASVQFEDALGEAFQARSSRVRIFGRGEAGASEAALRIDVTAFEVRYAAPGATPTAHVAARAILLRRNGAFAAEERFVADAPAAENGVRAIVDAMEAATAQVDAAVVAWTDAHAAEAAVAPPPAPLATRVTATRSSVSRPAVP